MSDSYSLRIQEACNERIFKVYRSLRAMYLGMDRRDLDWSWGAGLHWVCRYLRLWPWEAGKLRGRNTGMLLRGRLLCQIPLRSLSATRLTETNVPLLL